MICASSTASILSFAVAHGIAGSRGALTIYSVDAFDTDGRSLLSEMPGDLAYGVSAFRDRAERADAALRQERSMAETLGAPAGPLGVCLERFRERGFRIPD